MYCNLFVICDLNFVISPNGCYIKLMYRKNLQLVIFTAIILFLSFLTYFHNYSYPPNLFWDENYHIASAEKYLQGIFFMEPHPPLGKLFIALGELIINPNKNIDKREFLATDYIQDIPQGYSFAGVRFFPVLFATLGAVIFYLILYTISGRVFLSFLFTSLYLFDNALIVHNRGAMLEGTQVFFILILTLYFVRQLRVFDTHKKPLSIRKFALLGLLYGIVISIKLNGLIFGIFPFILLYFETYLEHSRYKKNQVMYCLKNIIIKGIVFIVSTLIVFFGIYYVHFCIASNAFGDRYYEASKQYKAIINTKKTTDLKHMYLQLQEHLSYVIHYQKGVPVYDACKPDENGSLPVTWPFGGSSINYRWETASSETQYLYLQGNPVIWGFGLLGVFISIILIGAFFLFRLPITNRRLFSLICIFITIYIGYMVMMMGLNRVMYLYHYFIPLILSLILCFLLYLYVFDAELKRQSQTLPIITVCFIVLIIVVYFFFSPFTYYLPLTGEEFQLRNWFSWWKLKPI